MKPSNLDFLAFVLVPFALFKVIAWKSAISTPLRQRLEIGLFGSLMFIYCLYRIFFGISLGLSFDLIYCLLGIAAAVFWWCAFTGRVVWMLRADTKEGRQ